MIEVLRLGPAVLGYRIDGAIERADIERAFAEADERLSREGSVRVYLEVHAVQGITWDALWRDVWMGLQRLNLVPRIERAALVTDLEWLRRAASVPDRLIPGLEIQGYPLAEQAQAQSWVQS